MSHTIKLTDNEIKSINEIIQKKESRARANRLRSINNIIIDTTIRSLKQEGKKIKQVIIVPNLYSKSKQFYTTATTLTLHFYKNGKLKSFTCERLDYPNSRVYNKSDWDHIEYYN